jgi:hypothetical protein
MNIMALLGGLALFCSPILVPIIFAAGGWVMIIAIFLGIILVLIDLTPRH